MESENQRLIEKVLALQGQEWWTVQDLTAPDRRNWRGHLAEQVNGVLSQVSQFFQSPAARHLTAESNAVSDALSWIEGRLRGLNTDSETFLSEVESLASEVRISVSTAVTELQAAFDAVGETMRGKLDTVDVKGFAPGSANTQGTLGTMDVEGFVPGGGDDDTDSLELKHTPGKIEWRGQEHTLATGAPRADAATVAGNAERHVTAAGGVGADVDEPASSSGAVRIPPGWVRVVGNEEIISNLRYAIGELTKRVDGANDEHELTNEQRAEVVLLAKTVLVQLDGPMLNVPLLRWFLDRCKNIRDGAVEHTLTFGAGHYFGPVVDSLSQLIEQLP